MTEFLVFAFRCVRRQPSKEHRVIRQTVAAILQQSSGNSLSHLCFKLGPVKFGNSAVKYGSWNFGNGPTLVEPIILFQHSRNLNLDEAAVSAIDSQK